MDRGPIETNKAYNSLLSSIQILLDDIEFGKGDWLYILRDEDGSDRLVYRRKPLVISNFLWAPRIDENEIVITRWGIYGNREGQSALRKTLASAIFTLFVFDRLVEWERSGFV